MADIPLVRLLSMALRTGLEELHEELARAGFADIKPVHGYALNAVSRGGMTTSALGAELGMTKQGAARVVQHLLDEGYLELGVDPVDARNRPLQLTRRGRSAVAASMRIQADLERRWRRHVGSADMGALTSSLERIVLAENDGELPPVRPGW